jgi:hypothetical protein
MVGGHSPTLTLTLADGSSIVGSKFRKFLQTPSKLFFVSAPLTPQHNRLLSVWYAQQQAQKPSSKEQRIL